MNTANVSPAWLCLHVSKRSVTGISSNSGVGSLDPTANGDQAAPDAGLLLNEGQVQVMGHSHGPLLCLGGPGTGKTTTIVEAAATSSRSTLVLTFARSAADELRERIAARRGSGVLPTVSTFH